MEKTVLFEVEDGIALITLNRPDKHNAMNQDLLVNLFNSLDEVAGNDEIRVAIITGKGKSFCSGLDLSSFKTDNLFDPRGDGRDFMDVMGACKKPVIGAINGRAMTGGFEMALNCDFLIASEIACFADTHAKVGIPPGWGMTQLLQQAVGQRVAKQLSLSCQLVSAQQALQWGLVNEVVPLEELLPRARQVAADICSVNQEMMMTMKNLIEYRNTTTFEGALNHEHENSMDFLREKLAGQAGKS